MINRNLMRYCAMLLTTWVLIIACLPVEAQQYDTLLTLKGASRYNLLETFIRSTIGNPDKEKRISDWVRQNGDETEKEFLQFDLELSDMEFRGESSEKQLEAVEKYFQKAISFKKHYLLASLYYFKCDRYKRMKMYNKSIENSLYSIDEMKKDPEGVYFERGWPLYMMGLDFYHYKDYDKALELSLVAFRYNNVNGPNAQWFVKGCSDLVGMSYLKRGNFDSAKIWLDSTLHYAQIQNDTAWIGIATGNIGSVYYLQQQYSKAIPYFEKALAYCRKYNLWDNISPFCTNLADCYMQTGNGAAVPALLKEADYANRNNNLPGPPNDVAYFKTASAWYRSQGNAVLALQSMDSANLYLQKQDAEYSIMQKMQAEAKLAYRNTETENMELRQEEKKSKLMRYGLLAALLMIAVISILLFKRVKLRHQLKKEKLEYEKFKTEEELHMALTEIKDFTWHILEKNKLIETYTEEIEKLKTQNSSITGDQLASLEALHNATVLTDDEWAAFKKMFEKVHPGFLQRLKINYPDLTAAETRYLVFTKLNISAKEMAAMLGVSAEAVRSIRFRLKKKLDVEDNNELDRMANEV